MSNEEEIYRILKNAKTVAIVGLSRNPGKDSFGVARYLRKAGYRIIPVNPNAEEIMGERCFPRLQDIPETFDIVDVFRRPEHVPPVIDDALSTNAKLIWLQTGITVSEEIARKIEKSGKFLYQDGCISVAHRLYARDPI